MPLYFDCEIEILIFLGVNKLFFFIYLFFCLFVPMLHPHQQQLIWHFVLSAGS